MGAGRGGGEEEEEGEVRMRSFFPPRSPRGFQDSAASHRNTPPTAPCFLSRAENVFGFFRAAVKQRNKRNTWSHPGNPAKPGDDRAK